MPHSKLVYYTKSATDKIIIHLFVVCYANGQQNTTYTVSQRNISDIIDCKWKKDYKI